MPGRHLQSAIIGLLGIALLAIPSNGSADRLTYQLENATPGVGPCSSVSAATPHAHDARHDHDDSPAGNAADYPFDLVFIDAMVFNQEASVAMAEIARQMSERPEILGLADGIISTQVGDITRLRAWRSAWYPDAEPVPVNVVTGLGDEGLMSSGALSGVGETTMADDTASAVQRLCSPDGPFDMAFLTEIIPIQQRAVGMARIAVERAEHAELKALAQKIVTVQEVEVSQAITWLAEWYPQGPTARGDGTPASG